MATWKFPSGSQIIFSDTRESEAVGEFNYLELDGVSVTTLKNQDSSGLCYCCRLFSCECSWIYDSDGKTTHCNEHRFRMESKKNPIKITLCQSCGFKRTPIMPGDPSSLKAPLEFIGHVLECKHVVCESCFPYCDVCNPIPF